MSGKKLPITKLELAYNGSAFRGYQKQENARTIQGEIERCLSLMYKEEVEVFAAGRTDTGVHAIHQVVSFKSPLAVPIPLEKLPKILNALLPLDIRVWGSSLENSSFHARFSAKSRTYQYIVDNAFPTSPFDFQQKYYFPYPLDKNKLKKTLSYLEGEHHFGSFTEKPSTKNLIRTIYKTQVEKKGSLVYITIHGNAFLRRMIRIIVGTALTIASRPSLDPESILEILKEQDRNKNPFPTAPPTGLYFYRVDY